MATYLELHAAAGVAIGMSEVFERDGRVRVTLTLPRRNDSRLPLLAGSLTSEEARRVRQHYQETHKGS